MPLPSADVTQLLQQWTDGDRAALDRLVPLRYERLHSLAHLRRRSAPTDVSLNTTALLHEAYLKLVDTRHARFQDRAHFLAVASRTMRNLLIDHARARSAAKRGGGRAREELREEYLVSDEDAERVLEMDDALRRLEEVDPRRSEILAHRYFGGLSLEETAEASGISLATVKRDLRLAQAWLRVELSGDLHL